mmetsp:Transcript_32298/g.60810  ORF Transcript_32298/g.60810 Transcript_32298/m.60810 type:complete len:84 (-) Transcript_32298:368-619(-)
MMSAELTRLAPCRLCRHAVPQQKRRAKGRNLMEPITDGCSHCTTRQVPAPEEAYYGMGSELVMLDGVVQAFILQCRQLQRPGR